MTEINTGNNAEFLHQTVDFYHESWDILCSIILLSKYTHVISKYIKVKDSK